MDELLLENSLFTNQNEYDDIVKDKEKVADIFFINYFGFLSLYKLGARGDIKRYKSEEASLYPKYIGVDNKDVSLSVKMLFDARITHGSVTARMTKLLAKIKGDMLDPKDIDNNALKELLEDSKITTSYKPSIKIRSIMQQWIDDEFAIEWLAFYLYKVSRLPEYKDIMQEFIKMYKTGQYNQLYTNILSGARKKHTGNIPKDLQNNNPTVLAKTDTDNAVDSLSDKEKFMAMFKQAIEAEKTKITKGVNDVPVKNNADYVEDKTPEPKQEPPAPPPIEDIEVDLVELINESIKVNNGGKVEFIKPTGKNLIYKHDNVNVNLYMTTITDIVYNGFKQAGVTPYISNFEDIIYSLELAVFAMLKEYKISLSIREAVSLPRSIIIQQLIKDRVIANTGENLFPSEYDSYRSHTINSDNIKTVNQKYTNKVNTGEYGLKYIERMLSGDFEFDIDSIRGTLQILNGLASDSSIAYSKDSTITVKSILNAFCSNDSHEISDDEIGSRFIELVVKAIFDKKTTIQQIDRIGVLDFMNSVHMHDVVVDSTNGINYYVLTTDFYDAFKQVDGAQPYLDKGFTEVSSDTQFHLTHDTIPSFTIENPFIDALEANGDISQTPYRFWSDFNELSQSNWVTTATPNGIDFSEFTHDNIYGLYSKITALSNQHWTQVENHYNRFYLHIDKLSMNYFKALNEKAHGIYSIEAYLYLEFLAQNFDNIFPIETEHLTENVLNGLVGLAMSSTYFTKLYKGIPYSPYYEDLIERMYDRLSTYINKAEYDKFELYNVKTQSYNGNMDTYLTKKSVTCLLGEMTKYSDKILSKVKSEIIEKGDVKNVIGVTSYIIPRTKSGETIKENGGLYELKISDEFYDYAVDQVKSGQISLVDVHENISIKMLKDGQLDKSLTDQYMKDLYDRISDYNVFSDTTHHEKLRGESFDLLGMIVQSGIDFDVELFNKILDLYAHDFMNSSDKYISSMNGTALSNNVPFIRMMCDPTLNVAVNEHTDKIANLIFDSIVRRFSMGYGDTNIWELASVCLMRIKDKNLYEKYLNDGVMYHIDFKKSQFEYKEDKLKEVFNPEIFVKLNIEAQKSMVTLLTNEINRKRKSQWMEHDGVPLYIDQLMTMLLEYAKVNGDDSVKDLITPARLKTLMANSVTHQIDFDNMQLDLNNGIINTPKKLSKQLLLNLAKLNGFLNMNDIKKEIVIPRGTKAIDLVRHIKGEIKVIDAFDLKLKEIPYEKVDHTDESLKKVNAKMWKTRTDKHKDYMLIFDEEFKPNERTDNVTEFLKQYPNTQVLELAFHGTGRLAGAYICRYGFADVRGDVGIGIAGKMLGNGTYVAVNYDKSASYVTDRGTVYQAGSHNGYLFTLRCAIGERGIHHQYARAGGGLRVEEWCLKIPTKQIDVLSIFKCHSVTKKEAHQILGEYAK